MMRDGFQVITAGWTLTDDMDDLTDRIERAAEWTGINGPLDPDEERTIRLMICSQIARGGDPTGAGDYLVMLDPDEGPDDDPDGDRA